jgi:hypothetical protein
VPPTDETWPPACRQWTRGTIIQMSTTTTTMAEAELATSEAGTVAAAVTAATLRQTRRLDCGAMPLAARHVARITPSLSISASSARRRCDRDDVPIVRAAYCSTPRAVTDLEEHPTRTQWEGRTLFYVRAG